MAHSARRNWDCISKMLRYLGLLSRGLALTQDGVVVGGHVLHHCVPLTCLALVQVLGPCDEGLEVGRCCLHSFVALTSETSSAHPSGVTHLHSRLWTMTEKVQFHS